MSASASTPSVPLSSTRMKTFSRRKSAVGRPATDDATAALALRASDSFIMEMHAYIMGILSLGEGEQRSLISSSSSVYEYKHPIASRSRVEVEHSQLDLLQCDVANHLCH